MQYPQFIVHVAVWIAAVVLVGSTDRLLFAQFGDFMSVEEPEYEYPSALNIPRNRRPRVQAEERVVALKRFSLDFYQLLIDDKAKQNQNVACSPWSAAMILTMLHDGANAETAREIRKTLRFQGNSRFFEKFLFMVAFNARAKEPWTRVEAPLILETANSFWAQSGYQFHDSYTELLENRFLSQMFTADFAGNPAKAAKEINDWCAEETRGEIKKIIDETEIDPLQRMFILNAVYFKARWKKVFSVSTTKPEWFHHADGSVSKTPMMKMKESYFSYFETSGFKALRKDYCGNAHLLFILPDETDGLAELEKRLTPGQLRQIDNRLKSERVNVKIPRFEFESGGDLVPLLQKLGIESAFDPDKADFSKMTDEKGVFINFFRQRATIKVDEEGTVASAVAMGGMGGGHIPPKTYSFYADRPFLFLIRENTDNSILFMGRVHHPEKVEPHAGTTGPGSDI